MFYVKIEQPIYLKGEQQELYTDINKRFGIKPGNHLVKDGMINGDKGAADYWDYFQLFENLPTFRAEWNDNFPTEMDGNKKIITTDLFWENGLLLKESVTMEVHEIKSLSEKEDGEYLLLCSMENFYFQVIVR